MTAQDVLARAKQGDPKVISVLMNHSTQPKGIHTRVIRKAADLHILFEAEDVPDQASMVSFVQKSLQQVGIQSIEAVRIYGRQIHADSATWTEEIALDIQSESTPAIADAIETENSAGSTSLERTVREYTPVAQRAEPTAEPTSEALLSLADSNTDSNFVTNGAAPSAANGAIAAETSVLKRPEAVVLILFVGVLVLWQLYLSLIDEAAPDGSLNGKELARRLCVSHSTISRRKHREDFGAWSQAIDPDGITWIYSDGVFVPQL